jgi:protein-S-isoprenylcysteine O-methyltransferase Ste14
MQLAGRAPVIARFSIGTCTIVRHPGYSDTVVSSLGLAFAPSSWWALIPAALASGAAYATIEL